MEISSRIRGDYKIIEVGSHIDLYNIASFKKFFYDEIGDVPNIAIDMSVIEHADSSLIAALIVGGKKIKALGGQLALMRVNSNIRLMLRLANLEKEFVFFNSEDDII